MCIYMRTTAALLLVIMSLCISGCQTLDLRLPVYRDRSFSPLSWDESLAMKLRRDYQPIQQLKSQYRESTGTNPQQARSYRNRIIFAQMALVREYHDLYIRDRFHGADFSADALEIATVGTAAAATVVGGPMTKSVLAGISTVLGAIKSPLLSGIGRLRITEAILSRMEFNRVTAQQLLESRLRKKDIDTYPLEAAELDCIDYFYSLSADRAVVDITNHERTQVMRVHTPTRAPETAPASRR